MAQLSQTQTYPNIHIASDHAGFEVKNAIVEILKQKNYSVTDYGNSVFDPHDDYPDFVVPLAINMQKEQNNSKGIVLCRNGVGVSMVVNKFKDLRAGLCFSIRHVLSAINDDNINILALPVDYLTTEEIFEIVNAFLVTKFSFKDRHVQRLNKTKELGM